MASTAMTWRWVAAFILGGVLLALPAACQHGVGPAPAARPGAHLADLDYTLTDMNGHAVHLADFKGHPLLINFWGTWCAPCTEELPSVIKMSNDYRAKGLQVIGVAVFDKPADLRTFAAAHHMDYPILIGDGHDQFLDEYEASQGVPITWFIRSDGTISAKHQGIADAAYFEQQVSDLLSPASDPASGVR